MLKTKELQDQLAENKKHQLEAGGTKWEVNCYLRDIISHCYFLSSKKKGRIGGRGKRNVFERWRSVSGPGAPAGLGPYGGDREADGDEAK
jgi:hypothetical protein